MAFDLNGTLLDPTPVVQRQDGVPDPAGWGGAALDEAVRLSMADTLAGGYRPFPEYLRAALARRLVATGVGTAALDAMLERAGRMPAFPEAADALARLAEAGLRPAVVTNSAGDAAREALCAAGLDGRFDAVVGSDRARVYKPHPALYAAAAAELGAAPGDLWLVTAHGWDALGAGRAGWRVAWVAHREGHLPPGVAEPEVRADTLGAAAGAIVAAG